MWRVLYLILSSSVQEGYGLTEVRPAQGYKSLRDLKLSAWKAEDMEEMRMSERLFSAVSTDSKRHKLNCMKCHLNKRNTPSLGGWSSTESNYGEKMWRYQKPTGTSTG